MFLEHREMDQYVAVELVVDDEAEAARGVEPFDLPGEGLARPSAGAMAGVVGRRGSVPTADASRLCHATTLPQTRSVVKPTLIYRRNDSIERLNVDLRVGRQVDEAAREVEAMAGANHRRQRPLALLAGRPARARTAPAGGAGRSGSPRRPRRRRATPCAGAPSSSPTPAWRSAWSTRRRAIAALRQRARLGQGEGGVVDIAEPRQPLDQRLDVGRARRRPSRVSRELAREIVRRAWRGSSRSARHRPAPARRAAPGRAGAAACAAMGRRRSVMRLVCATLGQHQASWSRLRGRLARSCRRS